MATLALGAICLAGQGLLRAQTQKEIPGSAPQKASVLQMGRITGRVIRGDSGLPLSKAVVSVWQGFRPQEALSVRTDTDGKFEVRDLAPGEYRLRAQRMGFSTLLYGQQSGGPPATILVQPGVEIKPLEIVLRPAGVISGTIVDEDMEAVEGVEVYALRASFAPGGRLQTRTARMTQTDDRGYYRLTGLPAGFYYVRAGGIGRAIIGSMQGPSSSYGAMYYPAAAVQEEAQRITVVTGQESRAIDIGVRSSQTYTIKGVIRDSGDGAESPSSTKAYSVGIARGGGRTLKEAGKDGTFTLSGLPAGVYTLVGSVSQEQKPIRTTFQRVTIANSDVYATIDLGRTAGLKGILRWSDGKSGQFENLRLQLHPEEEEGADLAATIDSSGKFALSGIPADQYRVELTGTEKTTYLKRFECGGEDYTLSPIQIEGGRKPEDCEVTLARDAAQVSGTVHDEKEDKPVPDAIVVLVPNSPQKRRVPRHTVIGKSNENGQFQISGVIPGEYFAFAVPPSDDNLHYNPEFPERNSEKAVSLRVSAPMREIVNLKFINPR